MVVFDKPSSLPTEPTIDPLRETLYHRALKSLRALDVQHSLKGQSDDLPYLKVVHRLDRDTSGLVVMALNAPTAKSLSEAFASRKVDKRYLIRCLRPRSGELKRYIDQEGEVSDSRVSPLKYECFMAKESVSRGGQSLTLWRVVKSGGIYSRTDFSLVESSEAHLLLQAKLYTGRTHQIRVHLASLGAPIMGDQLYGTEVSIETGRLALHSFRLALIHPRTDREIHFESAPDPRYFRALTTQIDKTK